MASEWSDIGFDRPAPADDVARFLGEENRDTLVAVGCLRQFAAYDDDQWGSAGDWGFESGINHDTLSDGFVGRGEEVPTLNPIVPPARRYEARTELSGGVYDSGLG